MKLRSLFACAMASVMAFMACQPENVDLGAPSISLSQSEVSFEKEGGEATFTVTATRDWTVNLDEEAAKWLVVDPASGTASAEAQEVTVSVLENDGYSREAEVIFTIGLDESKLTVKQDGAQGAPVVTDGEGTLESPYSASKAQELASALGENDTTTGVFVQGTVKSVKEISVDFGNATYWITDDAGTVEFYVYRGKNLGNTSFTSDDQLKAGDKVVVYGDLMNYKGDSPQLGQGNYIVELNGEKNAGGAGNNGGTPSDGNAIYSNNFDKTTAAKNSSNKWPYCDEFDGWKNQAGTGAANVTYAFKSASARATNSNNNIWLPKTGGYFSVQDIALGGTTSLELNFSVICGSPGNYKKTFSSSSFKVWLSADKTKWVELPVSVTANGTEFDSAVAAFSVPSSTSSLSITFEKLADETDGYRIDNVNLVSSTAAGTAIDFAQGVEKDFETGSSAGGGNNDGGNTPVEGQPTDLVKATIAEFLDAEVSSEVWYELTGEIVSIAKEDYGNFTIKDETDQVYIYGMTSKWVGSNDKSFSQIGLKVGDVVTLGTLRGAYNGEPQGGGNPVPAFYISHVPGEGGSDDGGDDPVTPPAGGDGEYDPNITWKLGEKAYDMTSGQNAQYGTVNGVEVTNMLKLGTSKLIGDAVLHVPAGTKKLGFYCVAWSGKSASVKFSTGGTEITTISPKANSGATGNPPYTITLSSSDYYEVELPSTAAADVKVETLDAANGRALFIGLKAIAE